MVLRQLAVGASRFHRSTHGRPRDSKGAARSGWVGGRGYTGLLAGRSLRAGWCSSPPMPVPSPKPVNNSTKIKAAWLQFEVTDEGEAKSSIRQTAIFDPLGLSGRLYWYAAFPLHQFVFRGMLDAIARRAVAGSSSYAQGPPSPRRTESADD